MQFTPDSAKKNCFAPVCDKVASFVSDDSAAQKSLHSVHLPNKNYKFAQTNELNGTCDPAHCMFVFLNVDHGCYLH